MTTKKCSSECEIGGNVDIEDIGKIVRTEVISASRRTDIPAFYMDMMVEAMKDGKITVTNQYGATSTISLDKKDVKCISWWSKDYSEWIKKYVENRELFDRYKHMFNFTLTGSDELEKGVKTSIEERIKQVKILSMMFGPETVKYRFDPIVIYIDIESGEMRDNMDKFEMITTELSKFGIDEVVIAFCIGYKKVVARMRKFGKILVNPTDEVKYKILDKMIGVTDKCKMRISSCCGENIVGYRNKIIKSKCIDSDRIDKILDGKLSKTDKDKGQRKECGCVISKDIGSYTMKCGHKCEYCYATPE